MAKKNIAGIGTNDLKGFSKTKLYKDYSNMCNRISNIYNGCSLDSRWGNLSGFKAWHDSNCVNGWELDKDLLYAGNRVYGPDACVFLPPTINSILAGGVYTKKTGLPAGVYANGKKYAAQLNVGVNKTQNLGTFDTPLEAHKAWQQAKIMRLYDLLNDLPLIYSQVGKVEDIKVKSALIRIIRNIKDDIDNDRITTKLQ